MLPALPPRRAVRRGGGAGRFAAVALAVAALFAAAGGYWFWTGDWAPLVAWTRGDRPVLVFEGERLAAPPFIESGEVLMALDDFRAKIDAEAFWDDEAGLLILSTRGRLLVFPRDDVTAFVNDEPTRVTVPVRVVDGTPYVPLAPLAAFYGLVVRYEPSTHTALVGFTSSPRLLAEATREAWLRTKASRFAPRLARIPRGEALQVLAEEKGFYRVELADGRLGYLPKWGVELRGLTAAGGPEPAPPAPLPGPPALPIDLTWDLVGRSRPSPAEYPEMPGLNVISPTWFHLAAGGLVTSAADPRYVAEAHARGWAVWPLFGNNFDPDLTHEVLARSEARLDLVRQLLVQAKLAGFDGINVDWENMRPEDRDLFSEFVRELVPLAHAAGLLVSVDVTFPGPSAFWQKPYDRAALGRAADYLVVMGYDQYTQGSSEAGPVSGFPWVEAGVAATVAEVPAWKVVLGVPFYSRVWTETADGLTTRAVGMAAARAYLERPGAQVTDDDAHGLPLVRWQEGGKTYVMWAETADTLRRRAAFARDAGLAGVASWQRALADDAAWEALAQGLGGR